MFSASRSYSSRTSCSRGERSSFGRAGSAEFMSEDSILSLFEVEEVGLVVAWWGRAFVVGRDCDLVRNVTRWRCSRFPRMPLYCAERSRECKVT